MTDDDTPSIVDRVLGKFWSVIRTIWQIHSLLGLVVGLIVFLGTKLMGGKVTFSKKKNVFFVVAQNSFLDISVCLGEIVVITDSVGIPESTIEIIKKHEYGHTRQSIIFGPLYIISIGIPSLYNWARSQFDLEYRKLYYTFYPEAWADDLGGVTQEERESLGFVASQDISRKDSVEEEL